MEKKFTDKLLFLGVDGMDPNLTKRYVDEGKLPNIKKLIERGARHEDLHMLGGVPTVTPPMWATLATGASPAVHGLTCFWNQSHERLDTLVYNFDSSSVKAERLWDVYAEAKKNTLVFHWPAGAWPPTQDNEYLSVIDGTAPGCVNYSCAGVDSEVLIVANKETDAISFKVAKKNNTGAGCIITEDFSKPDDEDEVDALAACTTDADLVNLMFTLEDGESALEMTILDEAHSPIQPAHGWEIEVPKDALEFVALLKKGTVRRVGLILKNTAGKYDTVKIYKNKKAEEPLVTMIKGQGFAPNVIDTFMVDDKMVSSTRFFSLQDLAEDGSSVSIFAGTALNNDDDSHFHPRRLYREVIDHCGTICAPAYCGGEHPEMVQKNILPSWDNFTDWQARAINYLIKKENYEIVFSHLHNVDAVGHLFWQWTKKRQRNTTIDPIDYQGFVEYIYKQTDRYVGEFLHLLDDDWTIFLFSDHGLMVCEDEETALFGDPYGVNVTLFKELGFTVLKKDENGNELKEIDWEKTRAVAVRANHIWINLKGRNITGIVDPADKYNLEEEIIKALYAYRDEKGNRIVSVALRNKDAAIVGLGGPECGDIIYWINEGHNRIHGDSLSTFVGYMNTTVSPIFIAAGKGIKKGCITERVIREMDVTPTAAVLTGVRMPAQCEGAPVYQIIEGLFD